MPQLGPWSSRAGSSPPTIATVLEKLQSALQKSRTDRALAELEVVLDHLHEVRVKG